MLKRLLPLAVIAVLAFSISVLNKGIDRNAPDSGDKDLAAATGLLDTPKPKDAPKPAAPPLATDPIPLETIVGNPETAKYKIRIGWIYDDYYLSRMGNYLGNIMQATTTWADRHPGEAVVEVVNLDAPPSELSPEARTVKTLGMTVNGKSTFDVGGRTISLVGNAGERYTADQAYRALQTFAK